MSLRLDLIVKQYGSQEDPPDVDRWTWRLWSGSRVVSTSGSQLFSRRSDCIRGAERGAGLRDVARAVAQGVETHAATRWYPNDDFDLVTVRLIDERGAAS